MQIDTAKLKVCVIGAGSIGQILAGRLVAHQHRVDLVARASQIENLNKNGIRLKNGQAVAEGFSAPAIAWPDGSVRYDALILSVRGEDLQEVLEKLKVSKVAADALILCQPILYPDPSYFLPGFSETCLLFPSFAAHANEDGVIEYFFANRPSDLGPLRGELSPKVRRLARVLCEVGLKTVAKPELGFRYTKLSVAGGPFGVAVSACDFNLVSFSKNRPLMKLARNAAIECMHASEALTGKKPGFLPGILVHLIGPYISLLAPLLSGRKEVQFILAHRRKVAQQDRLLLQAIFEIGRQRGEKMPALDNLLSITQFVLREHGA